MIAELLLLVAAGLPPEAGDTDTLGRYAVKSPSGRTICILSFSYEPTVGGEIQPSPHCQPARVADAARWFDKGGSPDIAIDDAIHGHVGALVENETLLELRLADGRSYDVEKLDQPPEPTPAERLVGSWSVYGDEPGKPLCHIVFAKGGRIASAKGCPPSLARFAGGRWTTTSQRVRLVAPDGRARAFDWSDPISLDAPDRSLGMGRD